MSRVRGTAAPDSVVLRRLAGGAGDLLRRAGAMEGSKLDRRLMRAAAAAGGHCVYLPEVWCKEDDCQALEALALDVAAASKVLVPHRTQKRLQIFAEGLKDSKVFPALVGRMLAAFGGLSFVDAWVNVYRDGFETTGAHQDHYNYRVPHAGATLNLNLGATRHMCCEHMATGERYFIPQENGSLFAFDAKFNCAFRHSVPADKNIGAEPAALRLSITVFAMEGPQPTFVTRDVDNVPQGVPLRADWTDWDFSDLGWSPSKRLPAGIGAAQLLQCGPLMRGHQKGGKGGTGGQNGKGGHASGYVEPSGESHSSKGDSSKGSSSRVDAPQDLQENTSPSVENAIAKPSPKRRWNRGGSTTAESAKTHDSVLRPTVPEQTSSSTRHEERRYDKDGLAYTKQQFRQYHGSYAKWDSALPQE